MEHRPNSDNATVRGTHLVNTTSDNLKRFIMRWIKRDGLVMLLFVMTTILMTYPLFTRLGGDWVDTGQDIFMKLWDIWFFDRILTDGQNPFFTNLLFHPIGVDLTYHNLSWTTSLVAWLLIPVTGSILSAYKVTALIGFLATSYGAYLLTLELTRNRFAAWLGGIIYAFAPYRMAHSLNHPDLSQTVMIPIGALLLIKAIRNNSKAAAVGAAAMVAVAAFTSMYLLTFVSLTYGFLILIMAIQMRRWLDPDFWRTIVVFGFVVLLLVGIRLLPWLKVPENLSGAIAFGFNPTRSQADLLAFITPSVRHPVFGPFIADVASNFGVSRGQPPYLGIVPILLTFSALTWTRKWRDVLPWFVIGVFFFLLSLGSILRFNGRLYEDVPVLYPYLDWFLPIRGVRVGFFHIGLLLPLAICSSSGLLRWLKALENKPLVKVLLVFGLSLILLFEYWNGPYPLVELPINDFYAQIGEDDSHFAIVSLPTGRPRSKRRLFYQTFHERPTVFGAISRTPDQAFSYVNQNTLLSLWRSTSALDCQNISSEELDESIHQLLSDDIRYIIIEGDPNSAPLEPFTSYFTLIKPFYVNSGITVYELTDLQRSPPCTTTDNLNYPNLAQND